VRALGREALTVPLDVTDVDSIGAGVEAVQRHFGRIDVLVNNAGVNIVKPAFDVTPEDWDLTQNVNLRGLFFVSQAVGRLMAAQGRGKIVNVASQFGLVGYRHRAPYGASKGGIVALTRTLAVEWAEHRITVNAIAPTYTATVHNAALRDDPAFVREYVERIPLGRLGVPEDLVGAVVYLASPSADMVTGQVLAIDGGWTAWWEDTLPGPEPAGAHVYALLLPNGRRFQVSEPLYRLAELLQTRLPAEEIAARLGARLGRSLSVADVAALVATKLAPEGVVAASERVLEQ
jgi:NAD(P)-dependent dehydrogenase (short-subunit alcohol dehydrogenase family)